MDKYKVYDRRKNSTFGLSQIAFDFGVDVITPDYELFFITKALVDQMDLIMVVERLEESLVLLKETLHWTLEDVAMIYLNHTLLYYRDGPIPSNLIEAGVIKLSEMNNSDMRIFKLFSNEFEKRIEKFFPRHTMYWDRLFSENSLVTQWDDHGFYSETHFSHLGKSLLFEDMFLFMSCTWKYHQYSRINFKN